MHNNINDMLKRRVDAVGYHDRESRLSAIDSCVFILGLHRPPSLEPRQRCPNQRLMICPT